MALFEAYEEQFQSLVRDINGKLDKIASGREKKVLDVIASANSDIEEAEEVLGKMEMELRSVKSDIKSACNAKTRRYKEDLATIKDTLKISSAKAVDNEKAERAELLGGAGGDDFRVKVALGKSMEQRARMTQATERLENSSERLLESRKIARETELIGEDIMQDLRQQRETLLHARDGLKEVDSNLEGSKKIVRSMARRIAQNKRVMYAIGVAVGIILLVILFSKIRGEAPPPEVKPGAQVSNATPTP